MRNSGSAFIKENKKPIPKEYTPLSKDYNGLECEYETNDNGNIIKIFIEGNELSPNEEKLKEKEEKQKKEEARKKAEQQNLKEREENKELIDFYKDDFAKYASSAKHKYLRQVFNAAPRMVGQRYKYSHVDRNIASKFLKNALELLCDARCLYRIFHTSGAGLPMAAAINTRKFKIIYLDVGLMQNSLGIQSSLVLDQSIMQINAGSIAEQFVGQELLAAGSPNQEPELFFWARDARGSRAEVDYLLAWEGHAIPVEVKAGRSDSYGEPETWVTERKQQQIAKIALAYLQEYDIHDTDCRFDVVAIKFSDGEPKFKHIKDAFWL